MGLSPKEQERIIEEEKLRFKVRQDLHAEACARHPRRGRWLWVLALLVLGWVLWMHGRCCQFSCHGMGRPGVGCPYHGGMMPPPDGDSSAPGAAPAPDKSAAAKDKDQ
ncbi:MAG TPA: hypothetical protein VNZ54_07385 [bacterium]|nr:hypothetical protein [bacterium]HXB97859.1 hypothetical protein [bacterium]